MTRAVFLDRDGVLNRAFIRDGKPYPPANLSEFQLLPGVANALWRLKNRGFLLIVVTNQPDVARGTQQRAAVEEMHAAMQGLLPIDACFVCYHDDPDGCDCRKPKPGLLLQAAAEFEIDLKISFMVGDRWRDVDAGRRAGCIPIWIDRGYAERGPYEAPAAKIASFPQAVDWILQHCSNQGEPFCEIDS
jgi:D-glycero-D-manno-heptose 1,7-bisphosphate phosphatase